MLFPKLMGRSGDDSRAEVPLSPVEREVLFLYSREGPGLVLKPTLDLPEAANLDAELLDRQLFPIGVKHQWYVLQAGVVDQEAVSLDLIAEPLTLILADGERISPVALGTNPLAEPGSLAPYLLAQLRSLRFGEARVVLDPADCPRILLAYPSTARADQVAGAEMGARKFELRSASKDDLDSGFVGESTLLKAEASE